MPQLFSNYDDAAENLENQLNYNIILNHNNKVQVHEEQEKVSVSLNLSNNKFIINFLGS